MGSVGQRSTATGCRSGGSTWTTAPMPGSWRRRRGKLDAWVARPRRARKAPPGTVARALPDARDVPAKTFGNLAGGQGIEGERYVGEPRPLHRSARPRGVGWSPAPIASRARELWERELRPSVGRVRSWVSEFDDFADRPLERFDAHGHPELGDEARDRRFVRASPCPSPRSWFGRSLALLSRSSE